MTEKLKPDPTKKSPASAAERQRRYRISQGLVSINISRGTASTLKAMRPRFGSTNDALISRALAVLGTTLTEVSTIERCHQSLVSNNQPISTVIRHTLTEEPRLRSVPSAKPKKDKRHGKNKGPDQQLKLF